MTKDEEIALNLKNAPLIVALPALDSNAELKLEWPDTLGFAGLDLAKKESADINDKLDWIRRQYTALLKNPKTKAYAPHVVPYLAQADLYITAVKSRLALAIGDIRRYPLDYTRNLAKTLDKTLGIGTPKPKTAKLEPAKGAIVADRTRFRVFNLSPRNELEAGFRTYYKESGLAHAAAYEAWLELDYETKQGLLKRSLATGRAEVEYQLEIVLEPQLLLDGLASGFFTISAIQAPTPSHGYSLPKNLADGGMIERCFDISYELYSQLLKSMPEAAPLVCLWGHRQRALVATDLPGLKSMASAKKSRLKRLANVILDKLGQKHPLVIEEVVKEVGATKSRE